MPSKILPKRKFSNLTPDMQALADRKRTARIEAMRHRLGKNEPLTSSPARFGGLKHFMQSASGRLNADSEFFTGKSRVLSERRRGRKDGADNQGESSEGMLQTGESN